MALTQKTEPPINLSVIIPVHDEPASIGEVVAEVTTKLRQINIHFEIIVIDDGSSEPVKLAPEKTLTVLHRVRRGGSGSARKFGSASARGKWIVWIDGDGTYSATDILKLWEAREGFDQVIGARNRDFGRLAWLRICIKRLLCCRASLKWKQSIPDLNSGLRLFRREAAEKWTDYLPDGFSCTTTATLASLSLGQRIKFIDIEYYPRRLGARSKFHPLRDTLRFIRTVERW